MLCDRRGFHKGQERKEILQLVVKSEKITDAPRTEILFERLSKRGIMLTLDTHERVSCFSSGKGESLLGVLFCSETGTAQFLPGNEVLRLGCLSETVDWPISFPLQNIP